MRNPFYGDIRVDDAAMSLAKLMALHKKPILFSLRSYVELVLGINTKPMSQGLLDAFNAEGRELELSPELAHELKASVGDDEKMRRLRNQFVAALSDAFTNIEVCEIAECVLAEIGGTNQFPTLGEAEVYGVFPIPKEADALVLDL